VIEVKPEGQPAAEPTPEQNAIISDLHWLVHQGHVIEFADGRLETAKKPAPRPPKPEKKPAEEKPTVEGEIISATEPVSPTEAVAASAVDIQVPAEVSPPTVEPGAVAESVVPPPDETTEEAVESPS